MRTLVVYYSRSGTTRDVAHAIARAMGAEVEEIVDTTPRSGPFGYFWSAVESSLEIAPSIQAGKRDPRDYDLVIVGTPVWASNVSTPVRAYLSERRGQMPKVAFFCTMGGRGSERAFRKMEAISGASPVARLALREGVRWKDGQAAIQAFVETATEAVEAPPRPAPRPQPRENGAGRPEARA